MTCRFERYRLISTIIRLQCRMALFTFLLEFDGGTYISQYHAKTENSALALYASRLLRDESLFTLPIRRKLSRTLAADKPVAIEGVRNVWCCSTSIGNKLALLNIVATVNEQ